MTPTVDTYIESVSIPVRFLNVKLQVPASKLPSAMTVLVLSHAQEIGIFKSLLL